jgi:uncharacterized cupredoxin-like copper-binding protein
VTETEEMTETEEVTGTEEMTETEEAAPSEEMTGTEGTESSVDVSLVDGAIEMPEQITAGSVTFEVTNNGTEEHGFEVEGEGVEEVIEGNLQPGESGSLTFELAAGEYRVYCPVADHAAMGMELTLTVE